MSFPAYVILAVGGVWIAIANPDGSFKNPGIAAAITGCVFGGMTVLSAYLLLACRRLRLAISPRTIRSVGPFSDHNIVLADVTHAQWRRRPVGGSLVLYSSTRRVLIAFGNYERARQLVQLLRDSIAHAIQRDYEQFEIAWLNERKPTVIADAGLLRMAFVSLLIAVFYWMAWDVKWIRATSGLPLMFCPSLTILTAIDLVRRPTRRTILAMMMSTAATFVFAATIWPVIQPLFG